MKLKYLLGAVGLSVVGVSGLIIPTGSAIASEIELTVYGEATQEFAPDSAKIYGAIKNVCVDCSDAKDEVLQVFNSVGDDMEGIGLKKENLKTGYYYENLSIFEGSVISMANLDFHVEVANMEDIENIIELLSRNNVEIRRIKFEIEDETIYNSVLAIAKENAIAKAQSIVDVDSFEISEIEEECYYYCNYSYKEYIELENQNLIENVKVSAKVKVTFEEREEMKEEPQEDVLQNELVESEDVHTF